MEFAFFVGRFHPLIVHLPIGFLLLAMLMWGVARWRGIDHYDLAIRFGLFAGAISAILACLLGYFLSLEGGFDSQLLNQHTWAGILTALFATATYLVFRYQERIHVPRYGLSGLFIISMLGISVAGHLGGSLTHGEEYLVTYSPFRDASEEDVPKPQHLSEVILFTHVVAPMLEAKCVSCHGKGKQKGGLSLSNRAAILKGGENGAVLVPGKAAESELIKRIMLAPAHKEAMPPKGKTPLTEAEKACLSWWIDQGASFDQRFSEMNGAEEHADWIADRLALGETSISGSLTVATLPKIPAETLASLRAKGFVIRELVDGSNLLDVTFPPYGLRETYQVDSVLKDIVALHDHIVWLNLSSLGLKDEHLTSLAMLPELEKLRLSQNKLSSRGVMHLSKLPKLRVLNVYGNPIGEEAIPVLEQIPSLERVYAWQTQINKGKSTAFEIVL